MIGREVLRRRPARLWPSSQPATIGTACLIAVGGVAVVQALHLSELMDTRQPLSAGHAPGLVGAYALAAIGAVAAAASLPARLLWVPVAGAASLAGAALVATLLVGGEIWSLTWAVVTMAACWQIGRRLLTAAGTPGLAVLPPVAWLAGVGALGLALLFVGRAGILSWWTVGAPVLLLGAWGIAEAAKLVGPEGARAAWSAGTSTRLAAASAALSLLAAALAAVWVAAPEIMFDALSYKAWLPGEWARAGEITPLVLHPYLNVAGFAQIIAIPGHIAGAEGVGRYLQLTALGALVATVWWAGRRSAWAPVAAAVLALTPLLFWEATTAYDDALLALAAVAMGAGVLIALRGTQGSALAVGAVLGGLAGVCLGLKYHLAPLAAALLLGWLLMRGRAGWKSAISGAVTGALVVGTPPLILRWIDMGNPVLPFFNDVFESSHWPSRSAGLNVEILPVVLVGGALAALVVLLQASGDHRERWAHPARLTGLAAAAALVLGAVAGVWELPGSLDPASALWRTVVDPGRFASSAPVGTLGLLSVAVAAAVVLVWKRDAQAPAVPVLWLGVVAGLVTWYAQARDPRYLLPAGTLAVLALVLAGGVSRPGRRLEGLGLTCLAVAAVLLWPATVAQYWNVPGGGAPWRVALGLMDDHEYERQSTRDRDLLARFDRIAPPGALAASDPHQRAWLTDGRDLTPFWELHLRLAAGGQLSEDPAETLVAVRAAGVSWVITRRSRFIPRESRLSEFPQLSRMVEVFGRPVSSTPDGTLYKLPSAPEAGGR